MSNPRAEQVGGEESATSRWLTLPIYGILFIFETCLFIHFCITTRKDAKNKKIKPAFLRHGNILIVICLVTLCLELWSVLIDVSTPIGSQQGYCWAQMYVRIMSFIFLDSTMFLFWIIRIRHTFAQSMFKLSKRFVTAIFVVVPFLVLLLMTVLAIFMTPSYYAVNDGYGCVVLVNGNNNRSVRGVLVFGELLAFSLNIFYGVLFYVKLSQFQTKCATAFKASAREWDKKPSGIDVLTQKHTLLALISTISAIVAYALFNLLVFSASTESASISALQWGFVFIDIDMVIKSVTMLLMFNFYTNHFYKWCFCCISLSAIDCTKRCSCCSTVNGNDFNKRDPVFGRLKNQATVSLKQLKLAEEKKGDDDEKKEDDAMYLGNKWNIDGEEYTAQDMDEVIGTEFYNVRNLKYNLVSLLVKCRVADHPKMDTKIYQYASNDGEKLPEEESIFKQADRQKWDYDRQDLTRHRNAAKLFGDFVDDNTNHANLSKHKIYFRKSDPEFKYPFSVALKANTNDEDGEALAYYVAEKIRLAIGDKDRIAKFQYAPLLEGIVEELRSKKFDRNLLFRRTGDELPEKKPTKSSKNKPYTTVPAKSPVTSPPSKSPRGGFPDIAGMFAKDKEDDAEKPKSKSSRKLTDGEKKDKDTPKKRRAMTDELTTAASRQRKGDGDKPLKRRTKTDELDKRAQTARSNPLKKDSAEKEADAGRSATVRDKLPNINIGGIFNKDKDKSGNKSPTTPSEQKKLGKKTPTTPNGHGGKKTPTSPNGTKKSSKTDD